MRLIVNGEPREHEAGDVAALFEIEAEEKALAGPHGIAIALNGRVIRKSEWAETPLSDGDRIEIVRAMQGG